MTDIIGAIDEIGYTQAHPGSKKIQVNLKLKDLGYIVISFKFLLWLMTVMLLI
jgi:hypothetical protein